MAQFDYSKLEDLNAVVSAAGLTDKKKKNEAIRLGTTDPTSFTSNFGNIVSDFNNQVNDFDGYLGAGRKVAANQDVDPLVASMYSGSLDKHAGTWYNYDPENDPSTYKSTFLDYKNPGQDYRIQDLGFGKYDIYWNKDNTKLGTGYKGLDDTIYDYSFAAAKPHIKLKDDSYSRTYNQIFTDNPVTETLTKAQYDALSPWEKQRGGYELVKGGYYFDGPDPFNQNIEWGGGQHGWNNQGLTGITKDPQFIYGENGPWPMGRDENYKLYNTEADLIKSLTDAGYFALNAKDFYGRDVQESELQKWETLGQLLNGKQFAADPTSWRDFSNDKATQNVTGLNTLFGTTPLLLNDKLLAYKFGSLDQLAKPGDYGYQNDSSVGLVDNHGSTRSAAQLYRDYINKDQWTENLAKFNDDLYVTPDKAANLPGWSNKESYQYKEIPKKKSGILGGLGKILSFASIFIPQLRPISMIMNTVGSLQSGNPLGAFLSMAGAFGGDMFSGANSLEFTDAANLASQGIGASQLGDIMNQTYGGMSGMASLGASLGNITNLTGIPTNALTSGGIGAIKSALSGGNPLKGGLGSGLASMFNTGITDFTGSKLLGGLGGEAAKFGMAELFNKNKEAPGSGSVQDFLQTSAPQLAQAQQVDPEEQARQRKLIEDTIKRNFMLANIYRNRNLYGNQLGQA